MLQYPEQVKGAYLRKLCPILTPFLEGWMLKKPENDRIRQHLELEKALKAFRLGL
jgi:hypothetical protein